jgi:hypothetical protein
LDSSRFGNEELVRLGRPPARMTFATGC